MARAPVLSYSFCEGKRQITMPLRPRKQTFAIEWEYHHHNILLLKRERSIVWSRSSLVTLFEFQAVLNL